MRIAPSAQTLPISAYSLPFYPFTPLCNIIRELLFLDKCFAFITL
jgi:hypothetical protein